MGARGDEHIFDQEIEGGEGMIKKLLCYLFGHRFMILGRDKLGVGSLFAWVKCSRCGKEEIYQYDY